MSSKVLAIAASLVLVLLTSLLVLRRAVRSRPRRPAPVAQKKGMEVYLGLRNQALRAASAQPGSGTQAVLMDMGMSGNVATVVAFADGTTSIYLSSGGGFIGGGQKHESIRSAGQNLIAKARESQTFMHMTQDYPLPQDGQVIFYVVTGSGVLTATAPEQQLQNPSHAFARLYAAGQEIITQYRLTTSQQ